MRSTAAWALPATDGVFEKITIQRRDVGPHDVMVAIAFAGVCHSDIHTGRNEWGEANFPLVPGHEITGTVESVGSAVTTHEPGDRVGVGVLVDSCRECDQCIAGAEQFCRKGAIGTYGGIGRDGRPTDGGYSTHIVVDEHFVVRIPDELSLDTAAPLLCAGITTYSPLRHWGVSPRMKVAVIGLGGLGHLAVQLAAAMGADVTVLSQTMAKQADGRTFGAKSFHATNNDATFTELDARFQLLINTVSADLAMERYLGLLDIDGVMVSVGLPPAPLQVPAEALIDRRLSWAGSSIGGIAETEEMLQFCAAHHIESTIETIGVEQVDEAWDRVVASDVRYRFVIDVSTLGE